MYNKELLSLLDMDALLHRYIVKDISSPVHEYLYDLIAIQIVISPRGAKCPNLTLNIHVLNFLMPQNNYLLIK